jgi:PAS domain S-box-containing protein
MFHCHVEPLRNRDGVIMGSIGIALDITDNKVAERKLLTAYAALETLVEERTAELVSRFKADRTLTFVNEAFCKFFGREREALIGSSFTLGLHPDDVERVQKQIASITPETRSMTIENRIVRPDSDIRWIQWTFTGLYDDLGGFREFQSVGRDITERKSVETLLALQYEATQALAESSNVSEANTRALRAICENLGWDLGILWKVDINAEMLRFEGIWHVPGVESIMVEHRLHPQVDLPNQVWKKKQPLWIPGNTEGTGQIETSEGGFRSVLAFPVKIAGSVVAVVECFSRTIMQVTPGILQALESIGHQLGNYRDRKVVEESVRKAAEELEARVKQRTEQLAGALEALSNSEMRFRAMFEGAPLGIALLSGTGTIIERNPTLERMLGYQEGALYGLSMNVLMHPEDLPMYEKQFNGLISGLQNQFREEFRCLRRDGTVLWGSLSCSSMHFEGSVSPFIITMIKDVTERKEMEEELRVSENRFRTVFEESPIGIALVDLNGRFIQASQAFLEMVGSEAGELLTKNISDLAHAEDGRVDQQRFRDLVEGRRSRYQMELRFPRKDGSVGWGNLNAAAIRSGTGEFLYGLRLLEDITLRKETEKRMQMLAHTITSMKESVVITDVDLAIISVNEAFLKTFDYDEHEILGKHVSALRPPGTSMAELTGIFDGTMSSGWTGELRASRKNGEVFPMLLSTSVVRGDTGKPIALVGIARDVTEQKRLQEKLAEAEKRRLADLRRFAISVQRAQEDERQRISRELHDDICQRLSGMKLNMEVLEDDFKSKDQKTFRTLRGFKKQFEQTITEVRRLSSNLRPTVLDDFGLTIALNLLGREFERAHKVTTRVELGDPTLKHLDPQIEIALYRIAQESLTNIAKHANASHVTLRLALDGSLVVLTVKDDGNGFDPKELPHSKRPGHGLGLISMRERAELLGGTWEIQSVPNAGTTIQVTIPVEVSIDHEEN